MSNSIVSEKSLFPLRSEIPAHDDEQSVPALRNALAMGRIPLAERMLDSRKLEAVLKTIVRRKKQNGRRILAGQF
jgi:hypothetical protein